ncbi:hypothetical protein BHE74_00014442 [Ensete ventricosum]|uniref:Uncharacterized protein n=1 Tax=Ensete ventricosum TaxID=4639 RepID=A0A444ENJ3_ENSVE|nr:hypothetical protein B296_00017654 [Ensete ventricosum]RWW11959.1 hypothetical protein GW17_00024401 [Ensete ventricosum]RWW77385.1 hypothetical protein BHE74_00014442 [Ensete ventricosum]RZR77708.1 hypothetical protein BHM03_00002820 [Ensete ventricosum]
MHQIQILVCFHTSFFYGLIPVTTTLRSVVKLDQNYCLAGGGRDPAIQFCHC